jgi:hypothetical protein
MRKTDRNFLGDGSGRGGTIGDSDSAAGDSDRGDGGTDRGDGETGRNP